MKSTIMPVRGGSPASPERLVVVTATPNAARWMERELLDDGPLVGVRVGDLESTLESAAGYLAPMVPRVNLLQLASQTLATAPELAVMSAEPSYLAMVLDLFAGLARAKAAGAELHAAGARARDAALLEAFARFGEQLERTYPGRWWAGNAPSLVARRRSEVPFLARAERTLAVGFAEPLPWQIELFGKLGAELVPETAAAGSPERVRCIECAGPEPEIAGAARILRDTRAPSAVFVPADEVPRWVRRLRHRDVPVRAWITTPCLHTAVSRCLRAVMEIATSTRWSAVDIETVLLGGVLRPFRGDSEGSARISLAVVRELWRGQRRGSGTAEEWLRRLRAVHRRLRDEIESRAKREGWDADRAVKKIERIAAAVAGLEEALRHLAALRTAGDAADLLESWKLRRLDDGLPETAAERRAAFVTLERLREIGELPIAEARPLVLEAVDRASAGEWVDDLGSDGCGPVKVVPHDPSATVSFRRCVLAGLDRYPIPPAPGPLLADATLHALGLGSEERRYIVQLRSLDRLAGTGETIATWRDRDGMGTTCSPGPWILNRVKKDDERLAVGDVVPRERALSALEADVVAPERVQGLADRAAAISSHEGDAVGPHTGELGVRVPPSGGYSISGLQSFAMLPYQYFVERVLKAKEVEESEDDLDAMEQGSALHTVLETAFREHMEASGSGVELLAERDALWDRLVSGLDTEIVGKHGELLAPGVVAGDKLRWETELRFWWDDLLARAAAAPTFDPDAAATVQKKREEANAKERQVQVWLEFLDADEARRRELVEGKFVSSQKIMAAAKRVLEGDVSTVAETTSWADEELRGAVGGLRKALRDVEKAETLAPGRCIVGTEVQFGSKDEPLVLDLGDRGSLPMTGRIDRVEWDPLRRRLDVVDYKSGRPKSQGDLEKKLAEGSHLQLPLYALAVEQQPEALSAPLQGDGRDARPEVVRLEFLKRKTGDRPTVAPAGIRLDRLLGRLSEGEDPLTVREAAAHFATRFAEAIESGHFPAMRRTDPPSPKPQRMDEVVRAELDGREIRGLRVPGPLEPLENADLDDDEEDGEEVGP